MYRLTCAVSVAMFVSAALSLYGCVNRSPGWDATASYDERAANVRVGQFTSEEVRLYHLGVQHIRNKHQKIGSFTIAQVVEQERSRESSRAALVERVRSTQRRAAAVSAYAKDVHLMFQLDAVGYRDLANAARAHDMTSAYGIAQRELDGVRMLGGLSGKKPDGFERT